MESRFVKYLLSLLFVLLLVWNDVGVAQTASGKKRKRVDVNFEDDLVQGEVQKPELFYLLQQKQFNYKRLIRLRQNFLPEMRSTAEELQRVGNEPK